MTEYRHVAQPVVQADELASAGPDYTPREAALIAKIRELEDARIALLLENQRLQFKYNEIKLAQRDLQGAFDTTPDMLFMHDKSGRIIRANRAYAERAGMTAQSVVGKLYWEVFPKTGLPLRDYSPDSLKASNDNTGEEVRLDTEIFLSRHFPIYSKAGEYLHTTHVLVNITRQKHAENTYKRSRIAFKIIGECLLEMVQAENKPEMIQAICRTLVEKAGYRLAWVCDCGQDGKSMTPAIFFGHRSEHLETYDAGLGMEENQHNPAGMTIQAGTPFFARNILNDPHFAFWHKDAVRNGYASILGLPLRDKDKLIGALCIYSVEPFGFETGETRLLTALAANLAFGITSFRIRAEGGAAAQQRELYLSHMRDSLVDTIECITEVIKTHGSHHPGHESWIAELATSIAREMGLSDEQVKGIRLIGLVHDIGEFSVSPEIFHKPGKLTAEETSLMRTHCRLGYDMLKKIDFPWSVAEVVLQHHERLDGSGYPRGLKGDQIMLEARIIGVTDSIVAVAYEQQHQADLGIAAALAEVEKYRGKLYDPAVVDAALRLFREKGFSIF